MRRGDGRRETCVIDAILPDAFRFGGTVVKQPHLLSKIGAVLSALLLSGGLLAYRTGAFHRYFVDGQPPATLGSSKFNTIIKPSAPREHDTTSPGATSEGEPKPSAAPQQPTPESPTSSQQPPATKSQEQVPTGAQNFGFPQGPQYMGGFKFGGVFVPPTFNPPPEKAPDASKPAPRSP
jgi:hypothetical protein